jgi:hypothetical protein
MTTSGTGTVTAPKKFSVFLHLATMVQAKYYFVDIPLKVPFA